MSRMVFEEVELTDEYDSMDDVVEDVIIKTAEVQEVTEEELKDEVIPITAIDEAAMPSALASPDSVEQETWDAMRAWLRTEVEARGYTVR